MGQFGCLNQPLYPPVLAKRMVTSAPEVAARAKRGIEAYTQSDGPKWHPDGTYHRENGRWNGRAGHWTNWPICSEPKQFGLRERLQHFAAF